MEPATDGISKQNKTKQKLKRYFFVKKIYNNELLYANLSSWFDFFSACRRHFVHRGNLLSWSMAVEHSFQRDGRSISLEEEEDGIIHRKGKQWERELSSFTNSHREPFNKWSLTCYTHHPSRRRHCQRFPSKKTREKHINSDWSSSPPHLFEKIFWLRVFLFSWKQRESERGPSSTPLGVNAIKISSITIGIGDRENARSAANGSAMAPIEIYGLSRAGRTHVEKSFNSITDFGFNLHISSTS